MIDLVYFSYFPSFFCFLWVNFVAQISIYYYGNKGRDYKGDI